jgi:hypothetical protein
MQGIDVPKRRDGWIEKQSAGRVQATLHVDDRRPGDPHKKGHHREQQAQLDFSVGFEIGSSESNAGSVATLNHLNHQLEL